MIDPKTIERVKDLCSKPAALGGWLGLPYEENGCLKFAVKFYRELGIEATDEILREARHFVDAETAQFGDLVIFHNLPTASWHVGVMLDYRRMIQSSPEQITNGVGTVKIDTYPWVENFRGFKRHKDLCS